MNKKKNPRTEFIIVRATRAEKQHLEEEAMEQDQKFSVFIREQLGLREDNN